MHYKHRCFEKDAQQGIVLFFALMALAVMSIAAVALIRSVDTNALVSGNLVFRQSAGSASNVALEGVAESIAKGIKLENSNTHYASQGYYATCNQFDTQPDAMICDAAQLMTMNWDNTNSSLAPNQTDGNDEIKNGIDRQGNEIRYVVERMCSYSNTEVNAGLAVIDSARCLMSSGRACGAEDSKNGTRIEEILPCNPSSDFPLYRVTLRIRGPKNTVTFMQSFLSN